MAGGADITATPLPTRGRIWVILILAVFAAAIGYAIVNIATTPPGRETVQVEGIGKTQQIFGGVPQEADRIGSDNAPVTIQVFSDLQCASCRESFVAIVPTLVNDYARPGDVKLLMRHYSVARNPLELGFFGAEAAAKQNYGWNYTYLFFVNQDEAERFGVGEEFMDSIAGSIENLDKQEWKDYLESEGGSDGRMAETLEGYEELGTELGIRADTAAIVTGPDGTRTLQDGPSLARVERAIEEVGG